MVQQEDRLLLDKPAFEEKGKTADQLVADLRDIAQKVNALPFGTAGTHTSRGPHRNSMTKHMDELANTIQRMADTAERLTIFMMQAGVTIAATDE